VASVVFLGELFASTAGQGHDSMMDAEGDAADRSGPRFEAAWVAVVKSTADRLEGELQRIPDKKDSPDYTIAEEAIKRARKFADHPTSVIEARRKSGHRLWRRFGAWWTGDEVDQAWASLHTAGQALLAIESDDVVRAQMGDMAATVVTTLTAGDLRMKDYLKTLQILASPNRKEITAADRAQLRSIRAACDNSSDGGHSDARAYRNTLILVGTLLAVVLAGVAILAFGDNGIRSVFAPAGTAEGRWYVFEIEIVASLAGLTSAVLALQNYTGFQYTYGLPLVQAFLKGGTGAATGLMGVALVQGGIVSSLKPQTGGGVFAVAIIFGFAQYLFTKFVDQKAKGVLGSVASRNDPGVIPAVPAGGDTPTLLTTKEPELQGEPGVVLPEAAKTGEIEDPPTGVKS
jgi:hypothetical protein